jgi:hypothetical protein
MRNDVFLLFFKGWKTPAIPIIENKDLVYLYISYDLAKQRGLQQNEHDLIRDIAVERAAISAPNGGNRQNWRFLVIKDATVKQRVQYYYGRGKTGVPQICG